MRKGACGVESGESGGQVSTHVRGRPVLSVPQFTSPPPGGSLTTTPPCPPWQTKATYEAPFSASRAWEATEREGLVEPTSEVEASPGTPAASPSHSEAGGGVMVSARVMRFSIA